MGAGLCCVGAWWPACGSSSLLGAGVVSDPCAFAPVPHVPLRPCVMQYTPNKEGAGPSALAAIVAGSRWPPLTAFPRITQLRDCGALDAFLAKYPEYSEPYVLGAARGVWLARRWGWVLRAACKRGRAFALGKSPVVGNGVPVAQLGVGGVLQLWGYAVPLVLGATSSAGHLGPTCAPFLCPSVPPPPPTLPARPLLPLSFP